MRQKKYIKEPGMGEIVGAVAHEMTIVLLKFACAYALALLTLLVMGGPDAAAAVMPGWLVTFIHQIVTAAP